MANSYLARTPSSAGNRKTWTYSAWFKIGNVSTGAKRLFTSYDGSKNGILVLGLDSMKARKQIVELLVKCPHKPETVIDGRMGAEHYQQYIYNNITMSKYDKNWYSDDDADPEPCTRKATSYCSNMSGSFISNSIKNIVMKQPYFNEITFNFSTLILDKKNLVS